MNAGDFFGLVAVILGLISFVWILAGVYKRKLDFKERQLELQVRTAAARAPVPNDRNDRNDLLEERVRVLERIATDRAPDLASQIEALRGEVPPRAAKPEEELN
jgi:hypothetical protein